MKQYDHFVEYQDKKVKHYVNVLHNLYQKKADLYKVVSSNKRYLVMLGFPYDIINDLQDEVPTRMYNAYDFDFDETPKYLTLKSNIVAYQQIVTKKIPHVISRLKHYTYLMTISEPAFRQLYTTLNYEILRHLLKGRVYEFPNGVGMIKIERINRCFNKRVVDWGTSNKLKKENPDKYIVYHLDDEYPAVMYHKATARVPNYKYYKFKFTSYINTHDRSNLTYYERAESIDQFYRDTHAGSLQKMLATVHLHGIKHFDKHGL